MKAIEGIDLAQILADAESQLQEEQRKAAVGAVHNQINALRQAEVRLERARQTVAKEEKAVESLTTWLERVKAGDWSVISIAEKEAKEPTEKKQ